MAQPGTAARPAERVLRGVAPFCGQFQNPRGLHAMASPSVIEHHADQLRRFGVRRPLPPLTVSPTPLPR